MATPDLPRRLGLLRRCGHWLLVLAALALALALTLWLIVHGLLLPRAQELKPWIEQRITASLGQPVSIGELEVFSRGGAPVLTLSDVRLRDMQGRTALAIRQVRVVPSLSSLWSLSLRMQQIYVEGLQLDIRRDAQGRLRVAGLDTAAQAETQGTLEDEGRALEWLLSQHEIALRGSSVRWTDEQRSAPPLELRSVDLLLRNGLLRHQLRLDATPPSDWGDRFTVMGHFSRPWLQKRHSWPHWSGTAYALMPRADVHQLSRYVSVPFKLIDGRLALRAWLDVKAGQWQSLTADIALADVRMKLRPHLQDLELAQLSARWLFERPAHGVRVSARALHARTGDGKEWPAGDLELQWQQQHSAPARSVAASASAGSAASAASAASAGAGAGAGSANSALSELFSEPITAGQLRAERIDLAVLSALATRLPLGSALEAALRSLTPTGLASALELRWRGPPDAPEHYEAKGRVSQLSLASQAHAQAAHIGRPGLSGADIDIELNSTGGRAGLAMRKGTLSFPGIFEVPLVPVDALEAQLEWTIQPRPGTGPAIELHVRQAKLSNADMVAKLKAHWRTGSREGTGAGGYLPGVIDLQGEVVSGKAGRIAAYLPLSLSPEVRHWVSRAVPNGLIEQGSLAIQGDIWQVPFNHPGDTGVFKIAGRLRDAQFDYLPSVPASVAEPAWNSPWPGFTQVSGDVLFDRATLTIDKMQARLWGLQFRDVRARIDDLRNPHLRVLGEGRGPLADVLRFVDVSPVGQWLDGGLKALVASGQGDLALDLGIPLLQPERSTVKGTVLLQGNDVQIRADMPLLQSARGRVEFTQQGFQVLGASARAVGGELSFDGGSQPDGSLRFQAQGTATAEGLRAEPALAPLPLVAHKLRGQTPWRAQLAIAQGRPDITVTSELQGLASDWPAPLNKNENTAWPLRWQTRSQPSPAGNPELLRDQIRLDVGSVLQLRLAREWRDGASPVRFTAAALGVNQAAPASTPNGPFAVRARVGQFDATAWQDALRSLDTPPAGTAPQARAGVAAEALDSLASLPRWDVQLQADELLLAGQRLSQVQLDAQESRGSGTATATTGWRGSVQAEQVSGRFDWRVPSGEAGALQLRLDSLSLPLPQRAAVAAGGVAPKALATTQVPATDKTRWPSMDLNIDALEWRGRPLGRVTVLAAPAVAVGSAAITAWNIERLHIALPGASLQGQGRWTAERSEQAAGPSGNASAASRPDASGAAAPPGRTHLDLQVDIHSSSQLAAHWGWADAVRGGNGKLTGRLAWDGEPWAAELASLDGTLALNLAQGQFLRAEPGIGRLLGILSLQSLPRRLLLDFRDVFDQGFAFDEVRGDIAIHKGKASTDNLSMRGVQAAVRIGGSADLLRETQDLRVLIVPELNAGAASLAYAAINPAVGLGTFLAQLLLRDPLRAAGSRAFHVTGSMAEPKVERVATPASGAVNIPASGAAPTSASDNRTSANAKTAEPAAEPSTTPASEPKSQP